MNCERREVHQARAPRRLFSISEQPAKNIAVEPDRQQVIAIMEKAAVNIALRPLAESLAARARWNME